MAWIESHDSLPDHPKTKYVAKAMRMEIVEVVGALHCLWYWCLRYAEDGDLTKFDPDLIRSASMISRQRGAYQGRISKPPSRDHDPTITEPCGNHDATIAQPYGNHVSNRWVDALIACGGIGKPGFLERTDDGRLLVHDWWDFAGKLIAKRKADRERKRGEIPAEFQRKSHGGSEDSKVPYPTAPTVPTDVTDANSERSIKEPTDDRDVPNGNGSALTAAADNSPTDDKRLDQIHYRVSAKALANCGLNGTGGEHIALTYTLRQVVSACHASAGKRNRPGWIRKAFEEGYQFPVLTPDQSAEALAQLPQPSVPSRVNMREKYPKQEGESDAAWLTRIKDRIGKGETDG